MATSVSDRPIVIRRVKKVVGGGHHGGAWKVAYADFVTAMMAFFMLLWLTANPDKEMLQGLAEYFSPAEEGSIGPGTVGSSTGSGNNRAANSSDPRTSGTPAMEAATVGSARGGSANVPDAALRVLAQELRLAIDSTPDSRDAENVKMEENADTLTISLMDTAKRPMFKGASGEPNAYAATLLTRIARLVAGTGASVSIEGHTDAGGGLGEANWKLSGERAQAARRIMQGAGLATDRFTQVAAMASTRPVYPDQPMRAENRRIAIIIKAEGSALPPDTSFEF
ncbi:flagellar motor protein MotB [Alteriqipengyuania lutimaris]|uniref:Flagellar motor protein MotB n=1 Tax=Alteriqipengyuania lutimaris TaxID=1538146 RepID=A0A395LNW8_9SPHN|nr:flagellar motor protein MotB [Alteriqipengyuania lutimaris]MBB3032496.1 chemotaxis protein MotB [Alteriqipengyuania lutimaris]RDS78369.1 flagellar motor protein MotB [Alteriqipengyuania lutimaris]